MPIENIISMNTNEARELLKKEKKQLQDSVQELIEEYEAKTGLRVLQITVIRAAGYGGVTESIVGIDPKIEL